MGSGIKERSLSISITGTRQTAILLGNWNIVNPKTAGDCKVKRGWLAKPPRRQENVSWATALRTAGAAALFAVFLE